MIESPKKIYDLAIIGGGIAGAAVARDAVLRNLGVVLFEKNSFGSGASSKSSKLIHGGIRYLELSWKALKQFDLKEAWKNFSFVFSSLKESRILEKIAPDLVKPIPLIIPIYKEDKRKPFVIYAGTYLYFILAFFSGKAKTPRIFRTKNALLKELPNLNPDGLKGGVMIWDHLTDDKALVQATISSAKKNGALCLESASVISYKKDDAVYEILVRRDSGQEIFYSKEIVSAIGPWEDPSIILPLAGSHITVRKFLNTSTLLQAEDGRVFFAINTGENCRVGTTEWLCRTPDEVQVPKEDVDYLLRSLERYFPKERFSKKDVLSQDAGIRPLALSQNTKNPSEVSRDHEIRVGNDGVRHLVGVKLTDHRRAAEDLLDQLVPGTQSRTAHLLLSVTQK